MRRVGATDGFFIRASKGAFGSLAQQAFYLLHAACEPAIVTHGG